MKTRWKLWLALGVTVLWIAFIFARSLRNADDSEAESGLVLDLLLKVFPFLTMHAVRKLAHFTEYFILGGLLYLDRRLMGRGPALLPLGAALLTAAADEYIQTFVPGRSGQLRDVLLDLFGAAAGIGAGLLLHRWKEAKRHRERREA